jgi:hypothetical protein
MEAAGGVPAAVGWVNVLYVDAQAVQSSYMRGPLASGDTAEDSMLWPFGPLDSRPRLLELVRAPSLQAQMSTPGLRIPAVEGNRALPPHRPREDGFARPADTSRSNRASPLGLLSRWRLSKLPFGLGFRDASPLDVVRRKRRRHQ